MKRILLILPLLLIQLFAVGVAESRYLETQGIIDIGFKDEILDSSFSKELVSIPAKSKLLHEIFDYKARDEKVMNCQVDDEGGETCPQDKEQCTQATEYSDGIAQGFKGLKTTNAAYRLVYEGFSGVTQTCNDHYLSAFFAWDPLDKKIYVMLTNASPGLHYFHNCGRGNYGVLVSQQIPDTVLKKYNKVLPLHISSWGGGCSSKRHNVVIDLNYLPKIAKDVNLEELYRRYVGNMYGRRSRMPGGNIGGYYFFNVAYCDANGAQHPYVQITSADPKKVCPEGLKLSEDGSKCERKDHYIYYEYKCPTNDKKEKGFTSKGVWGPPKNKGGDCQAVGLNENLECQSSTPPKNNCERTGFRCPSNPDQPCFKDPSSPAIAQDIQSGYEYALGKAKTVNKTVTFEQICENGGKLNLQTKMCEITGKTSCPTGWSINNENKCEKEAINDSCDVGDLINGKCSINSETKCPIGYVSGNQFKGQCFSVPECPKGSILTESGMCERTYFYSTYTCPAGYEGPIDPGSDCLGSCGADGCHCNTSVPPSQNCRKKANISNNTYEVSIRNPMWKHNILGKGVDPDAFGEENNMACNKQTTCAFNINKIVGKDNVLCFYKNNGSEHCIRVDDCGFSGTIGGENHEINHLYIENLKTIKSKSSPGSITSTCQLNGHVGFVGNVNGKEIHRSEGITSVAPVQSDKPYVLLEVTGKAKTYNAEWTGFNPALMAIQLSDGHWYTMSELVDKKDDTQVKREALPKNLRGLPPEFFEIDPLDERNIKCKYKGKDVAGCSTKVKIFMPNPKLYITGLSDIYSLRSPARELKKDEEPDVFDFKVIVNGDKNRTYRYKGDTRNPPTVLLDIKPQAEMVYSTDRLTFWDSFHDGYLGFLEFVREVRPEDSKNKFVPENTIPYRMASKGFTSIIHNPPYTDGTVFVNPNSSANCSVLANEIDGRIIPYDEVYNNRTKSKYRALISLGATEKGCVIVTDNTNDFQSVNYSAKVEIHTKNFGFTCSKWRCVDHKCIIATCPTAKVKIAGQLKDVTYQGTIVPEELKAALPGDACFAQVCDGNRPLGNICGIKYQPSLTSKDVILKGGKYYQYYCDQGTLAENGRSCMILKCPEGTTEKDGVCVKKGR